MFATEIAKKVVNGEVPLSAVCRLFGDNFAAIVVQETITRSWQGG